jgi:hypothetical protein
MHVFFSPNSLLANATVIGLWRRRRLRDRGRLGWACLHWRLDCLGWRRVALARRCHLRGRSPRERARLHWRLARLRWQRVTLAEVRILHFAICHELQIDLWQRSTGPTRLRRSPHDGHDAIHKKAVAGPGTALHKSRLLASCPDFGAGPLAWGRLHGDSRTETDDKRPEDGSPNSISVHLYRSMRQLQLNKS